MKMTAEKEAFLNKVEVLMLDGRKMNKKVKEFESLGFRVKMGGTHYYITHKFMGYLKIAIPVSPSDFRWARNKVSKIRHAMWKAAA